MTVFAEMSKQACKLFLLAALLVGFIAGVLRRRR
jgi:hypothetical protein